MNKGNGDCFAPGADGLELEARLVEAGGAQAQPEAQTEEFEADGSFGHAGNCDRREFGKVLYGTGGFKASCC